MNGCTRTAGCGIASDFRGAYDVAAVTLEVAPEAADDVAPATLEVAPEVAVDFATAMLELAPESAGDVAISVGRRASLSTVPVQIASSSTAIIVQFAILSLIRPIIYFANFGLNFEAFDDSAYFCG